MFNFLKRGILCVVVVLMTTLLLPVYVNASPPFYANCGDRDIFPELRGNYSVSPASGPVGTTFLLRGSESKPMQIIGISWSVGVTLGGVELGVVRTDEVGNFSSYFSVPAEMPNMPDPYVNVNPGQYKILLVGEPQESYYSATKCITFTVTETNSVSNDGYQQVTGINSVNNDGYQQSNTESISTLPLTGERLIYWLVMACLFGGFLLIKLLHVRISSSKK